MSLSAVIDPVVRNSVIGHLALFFLSAAHADMDVARRAAANALAAYDPETQDELMLAAEILGLSLQCLQALSQAADNTLADTDIVRLRASAVSLSRLALRSRAMLDRLQGDRRNAAVSADPESPTIAVAAVDDDAAKLIAFARDAVQAVKQGQGKAWAQNQKKRRMLDQMAENGRKNKAAHEAAQAATVAAPLTASA